MTPKRASIDLGRSHVFLTGATGFVGQAVLERLLSDHPETTISILVRTKAGADTAGRVRVLLDKPVFRTWRERVGDAAVEKAATERIRVVEGAMGSIPQLPKDLDVVIHSASVVSFDPPIDSAFDTNVNGAIQLYENLLAAKGDPRVVHVSTCYVGGMRKGVAPEARLTHDVDWRGEFAAAKSARDRVEMLSRESDQLRIFMDAARAKHEKEGPQAVAKASEIARVKWVTAELVDAGRTRAQSLGWTDVYTLTKAFAERAAEELWGENGHRLSVVRPAIIESALQHPFPGWIDGFKVADPLIMAYGRGLLPEFPGLPDSILDVIPVDYVVNAIIAAAANPAAKNKPEYYHVASGASNPLPFHEISGYVNRFFVENPMKDKDGSDLAVPTWKFPVGNKVERSVLRKERLALSAEKMAGPDARQRPGAALAQPDDQEHREPRDAAQLHAALSRLRAHRDHLRRPQPPCLARRPFPRSRRPIAASISPRSTGKATCWACTSRPSRADEGILARPRRNEGGGRGREASAEAASQSGEQRHGRLRPRGHRRRLQHRAAVPVGSVGGRSQGRLACRGRAHPRAHCADCCGPNVATEVSSFARSCAATRGCRSRGSRRSCTVATPTRSTATRVPRRSRPSRTTALPGHRTVLVTGSIQTLAAPLADLFDEVVGGHMHDRDGILTGYLAKPPLVDEARAAWVRRYAEEHGFDLAASYGYGDSHADLVWLELLGHPHAINPDTQLQREAQRRNWKIDKWKRGNRSPKRDVMEAKATRAATADRTTSTAT